MDRKTRASVFEACEIVDRNAEVIRDRDQLRERRFALPSFPQADDRLADFKFLFTEAEYDL